MTSKSDGNEVFVRVEWWLRVAGHIACANGRTSDENCARRRFLTSKEVKPSALFADGRAN